ncbi:MAG: hypothetical protein AB7G88_11630, partial [Thermomicrobiales bacterium]
SKIESTVRYLGIEVDDAIDRREDRHMTRRLCQRTWSVALSAPPTMGHRWQLLGQTRLTADGSEGP